MPKSTFSHRTVAAAPVAAVWNRLQDAAAWTGIGPIEEVWDPVHDEQGQLRSFRWRAAVGPKSYLGSATTVESASDHLIRLRFDGNEVSGELVAELAAEPGATTRLTVALTIQSVGILSTLLFPLVADAVKHDLPTQVDAFARSVNGMTGRAS